MKHKLKILVNKIMLRVFGHLPFPAEKEELKFTPINIPERKIKTQEFNRWTFTYQVSSLYNEKK